MTSCAVAIVATLTGANAINEAARRPTPYQEATGGLELVTEQPPRVSAVEGKLLRLKSGRGWVRTRAIVGDFTLTLEFKLADGPTDASVGIRTLNVEGEWPRRGYALRLRASEGVRLEARRSPLATHSSGQVHRLEPGAWHHLAIGARGRRVTISVDGVSAGAFDIDALAGSISFDVREGAAEFRNIRIARVDGGQITASDYHGRAGFASPQLVRDIRPDYAEGPMVRKVEGTVGLLVTVLTDGRVGAVRLVQALDPELEHAALAAVRRWRFAPATLDGKPVAAVVEVEVTFTLK
jgi:TonB family protein